MPHTESTLILPPMISIPRGCRQIFKVGSVILSHNFRWLGLHKISLISSLNNNISIVKESRSWPGASRSKMINGDEKVNR